MTQTTSPHSALAEGRSLVPAGSGVVREKLPDDPAGAELEGAITPQTPIPASFGTVFDAVPLASGPPDSGTPMSPDGAQRASASQAIIAGATPAVGAPGVELAPKGGVPEPFAGAEQGSGKPPARAFIGDAGTVRTASDAKRSNAAKTPMAPQIIRASRDNGIAASRVPAAMTDNSLAPPAGSATSPDPVNRFPETPLAFARAPTADTASQPGSPTGGSGAAANVAPAQKRITAQVEDVQPDPDRPARHDSEAAEPGAPAGARSGRAPSSALHPAMAGDAPKTVAIGSGKAPTVPAGPSLMEFGDLAPLGHRAMAGQTAFAAVAQHGVSAATGAQPMAQNSYQVVFSQISPALHPSAPGETVIRLDPPELGAVRISLTQTDTSVIAVLSAERGDIDGLLRRHASDLSTALSDAGFDDVTLTFGNFADDNDPSANWQESADLPNATAEHGAPAVTDPAPSAQKIDWIGLGQLDLRI